MSKKALKKKLKNKESKMKNGKIISCLKDLFQTELI